MYYSLIHERRCNKKPNTLKCLEYLDQSKSITGLALLAAALDAVGRLMGQKLLQRRLFPAQRLEFHVQ